MQHSFAASSTRTHYGLTHCTKKHAVEFAVEETTRAWMPRIVRVCIDASLLWLAIELTGVPPAPRPEFSERAGASLRILPVYLPMQKAARGQ